MTTIAAPPRADAFRASPVRGLPSRAKVDRDERTIYGAKAIQFGPLNSGDERPWKIDETTLGQIVALVNERPQGVKMRFAHPNLSRDGMGRHVGRAVNARIVRPVGAEPYVAIDARLHDFATRGPKGNLADHILDMAEKAPEDFGLSVASQMDRDAMRAIKPDENGITPVRFKEIRAIDFVDDPAATRGGLFSLDGESLADLPAIATELLDTFFGDSPRDVIEARFHAFLESYLSNREGEPMAVAIQYGPATNLQQWQLRWPQHLAAASSEYEAQKIKERCGVSFEDYARTYLIDKGVLTLASPIG